jgi:hypothetical protein
VVRVTQPKWRTLRCVVEVKVPPSNRSNEKDLIYQVERALGQAGKIHLPRLIHDDNYVANPKVKSFVRVLQAEIKRPSHSAFEQLVIRGIYAILSFTMPGRRSAHNAVSMLREDIKTFLGADE